MKNWPKVMEFCYQSWNFTNFAPNCTKFVRFYTKILSINEESLQFLASSTKCCKCKIKKRDGLEKLSNSHGKVMEKYFVKSVVDRETTIPTGMGLTCNILIVPTRPFWFSSTFSQTIVRLGLKLGEYLSNNILISLMTLEKLKTSDLFVLGLFCVSYFQDHWGLSENWFLTSSWLHALNQQLIWAGSMWAL